MNVGQQTYNESVKRSSSGGLGRGPLEDCDTAAGCQVKLSRILSRDVTFELFDMLRLA
jgi:hypothetical protein